MGVVYLKVGVAYKICHGAFHTQLYYWNSLHEILDELQVWHTTCMTLYDYSARLALF